MALGRFAQPQTLTQACTRRWRLTAAIYLSIYAGLFLFLAGCLLRIHEYSSKPLHLRWELYPVPHERAAQTEHGGSYFELQNWWQEPQQIHHGREWTAMLQEILLLKSLREFNRRLWLPSFLFHFGLYLAIAAVALLIVTAVPEALMPGSAAARLSSAMAPALGWVGLSGAALIVAGACLLLMRRLRDPALKNYTKAGDIFNLLFFVTTFAFLAAGFWMGPANATPAGLIQGVFHFNRSLILGPVLGTGLILASALIAYIPFTHMSHFIGKYFAWHAVRWDDRRSERGSAMEASMAENLRYRPTWAAAHMGADGKKSWAEIATANPAQEVRK